MSIRRPGWPMSSPESPSIRPANPRTAALELEAALGAAPSGSLILAAISAVFTIGYVAIMLGEDESIDMFPENGRLHVYGIEEDAVTAFTRDCNEYLKQIIA